MASIEFDTKKPAFIISLVFFALAVMLILFSLKDMKNNHKIDFRLLVGGFVCLVVGSFLLENSSNPFKKSNGNGDEDD